MRTAKHEQLAPWVADYYFDQGVAYQKARHSDDAIAAFNLYLMAEPDAADVEQVRERIGGLKYAKEKTGDEQRAAAARSAFEVSREGQTEEERKDFAELLPKIDGRRYTGHIDLLCYRVNVKGDRLAAAIQGGCRNYPWGVLDPVAIQGRLTTTAVDQHLLDGSITHEVYAYRISDDGSNITFSYAYTYQDGTHKSDTVVCTWQQ